MIKLVVFDWNGVLIADLQAVIAVDAILFKKFGHDPIDAKLYQEIFTMPVRDFFLAAGFKKEEMDRHAKEIQELFHELFEPRIARVRTRAGARTLLSFLEERKIEAKILSNHTEMSIHAHLKRLRIEKYFSDVISNDKHTTMQKKNKADKLVDLVVKSHYKKEEILIIGDSLEEIEAARASGIRCVSITGDYYSARRLKAAKPDFLINNLTEMIDIIKNV